VIRNFHYQGLQSAIGPLLMDFGDSRWSSLNMITLNINKIDIKEILAISEKTWNKLFPGRPFEYSFLDENFNRLYRVEEANSRIFGVFAILGLFVACLGLLGLASFAAELRTKEIGIRKVLGASISSVVLLLSTEFAKCILIANGVAWPIAYYFMNKWLQNFAYRVNLGLKVFILSGLAALAIALLALSYQTIKTATANPVDSLRYE
jgi:putative ABC transport system permease protein